MKKIGLLLFLLTMTTVYGQSYNSYSDSQNLPQINFKPVLGDPNTLPNNPMSQFLNWYNASNDSSDFQMMALSTSSGGVSASCTVWLENVTGKGFVFQSSPQSQQALDIQNNQQVALLFLHRNPTSGLYQQIRVEGAVSLMPNQNGSKSVSVNKQNMELQWAYYMVVPNQVSFDVFHPLSPVSVQETVTYQFKRGRWIVNRQPYLLVNNQPNS